ncbi:MAG: hypothetical protein GEV03_14920 [Streptosporangiales bacterium]|nr:hypothetical protein [Streptosporangiales bacterium]
MSRRHEDAEHEPENPRDEEFAPVLRGADAEGRTVPEERRDEERSGTGVPGAASDHPDTLPPDASGVREAERADESRPARRRRSRHP